jgi:monoamine oxidase
MPLTRRDPLHPVAAAGGASLVYKAMTDLGLLEAQTRAPFDLQGDVDGVRVVVVGAGLAGLTAAYELGKLGYKVQVLEARARPSGRVHTVRRGTVSEEEGPQQTAAFDEGLYFNCGAMRIPSHHATSLHYCRELQVPVEAFAVTSDSTYLFQQKAAALSGKRVRLRAARADLEGYVAELLSKAVSENALNEVVTADDRERLLEYRRSAGALDESRRYRGSSTRGPDEPASPDAPARYTPLSLSDLLGSSMGHYLDAGDPYQPTMAQVVGGTDRLPQAFTARLKDRVVYGARVREIRQTDAGVSVGYADHAGRLRRVEADCCICALPLTILSTLDTDFSPELKKTIASVPYSAAGKMGLQFKRRFWQEDDGRRHLRRRNADQSGDRANRLSVDRPPGEERHPRRLFHPGTGRTSGRRTDAWRAPGGTQPSSGRRSHEPQCLDARSVRIGPAGGDCNSRACL